MKHIKKLTYSALMISLVFISTYTIKLPLSFTGGYIHAGDGFVLLSGILLGPLYGGLAAGIGSALADILGGYSNWALPTFIIKAIMAGIIGIMAKNKNNAKLNFIISIIFSIMWISFILFLRNYLKLKIEINAQSLISNIENISDSNQLLTFGNLVQSILFIIALLIPLLIFVGYFTSRKINNSLIATYTVSLVISGSIMIILYYLAAYILYGNWLIPIFNIPNNTIQFIVGIIISNLLLPVVTKLINENNQE